MCCSAVASAKMQWRLQRCNGVLRGAVEAGAQCCPEGRSGAVGEVDCKERKRKKKEKKKRSGAGDTGHWLFQCANDGHKSHCAHWPGRCVTQPWPEFRA